MLNLVRLQDHFLPEISLPVLVQPENGDYHIANQNKLLEMCYLEAIVLEKRKNAEDYLTELREYFTKLAQLYLDCIYLPANEKDDLLTQISDEPAPRQTTDQQDKATLQKGQDSKKKRRSKKKKQRKKAGQYQPLIDIYKRQKSLPLLKTLGSNSISKRSHEERDG